MKYKIGYVDEDPAQVAKYTRELRSEFDVIAYDIKKGLTLDELIKQVYDSNVDLLLVDYFLKDKGTLTYNGDEVVRKYEEIKPRFPMIIFTNEGSQAFPQVDNPNIIYEKDESKDLKHFSTILKKNISVYINYITKRKENIANLLEKGTHEGLTAEEKHLLLESQNELMGLDKWSTEVPLQLLAPEKVENLAKTTKEAEEFLESLIKGEEKNDSI
jgi:hypothetical protein